MSHTIHPDSHEHGLADDCPRCAEHAEHPLTSLDARNLRTLVERTLRNRFGRDGDGGPLIPDAPFGEYAPARSDAEARAMAVVMTDLERTGKLFAAAPTAVCLYLRERWGVHVGIDREET